ncbi:hypothetical protein [Occultella kanbiaonis]|uniref:hypothetical protein n=1 Tax=Occultella kanbiaonis TaxID=2675754 RepID=UPI0012B7EBED|nr:hypothetical protein [Occultella kanbiaonis]
MAGNRASRVVCAVALVVPSLIAGAGAGTTGRVAGSAGPTLATRPVERETAAARPSEWDEAQRILVAEFGISEEQARANVESQAARTMFREVIVSELGETFAGFRFDPATGVLAVLTTNPDRDVTTVERRADQYGVEVGVIGAEFSYTDLAELARQATAGGLGVPAEEIVSAQIDDKTNTVTVYVLPERLAALQRSGSHDPVVRLAAHVDEAVDEGRASDQN